MTQPNEPTAVMTIDYHLTKQAEPYTSIRAGVSMPVFVTPDDDLHAIFADNLAAIKDQVQAEIDAEFEQYHKPAPYSSAARYQVATVEAERVLAIVPAGMELPGGWKHARLEMVGHRLEYIYRHLTTGDAWYDKKFSGYTIYDRLTNEGDLPELEYLAIEANHKIGLAVLVDGGNKIPDAIKDQVGGWWNRLLRLGFAESNRRVLAGRILDERPETTIIDCTDGDWSKITDYYQQHAASPGAEEEEPEPIEFDAPDDDDDEGE